MSKSFETVRCDIEQKFRDLDKKQDLMEKIRRDNRRFHARRIHHTFMLRKSIEDMKEQEKHLDTQLRRALKTALEQNAIIKQGKASISQGILQNVVKRDKAIDMATILDTKKQESNKTIMKEIHKSSRLLQSSGSNKTLF
eukprot:GILJ01003145.1.p1 GENE.GILJ01003145.1~~GILJ01003145.1.p1  ORF type:complete len:140 (+),score=18.15 GILJ01003145.1:52-471(+)